MKITLLTLSLAAFLFTFSTQTFAADFTVNLTTDEHDANTADGNCDIDTATDGLQCTLRAAVEQANALASDDNVLFDNLPANSTITLTGEIVIENAGRLDIVGTGANNLTIDGGAGTNRIFYTNNATSTITGVTLTGGNGAGMSPNLAGGAIFANRGTLVLDSVYITANSVPAGAGGGVYYSGGTNHQIRNSTLSDNTAVGCGGFYNSGGTLIVTNSTISRNRAVAFSSGTGGTGAGFCSSFVTTTVTTTLRNVTITDNSAGGRGGGFYSDSGTLNMGNTIIAGNTARTDPDISYILNFYDVVTTAGYNLIGNNTGYETTFPAGNPNANKDIVGTSAAPVNPLLGALANNGGTTPTHALLFNSPAIDKGNSFGSTIDQREMTRPVDLATYPNAAGGDGADIGAFETQLPTAADVLAGGRVTTADGRGIPNVRVTITDLNGATQTVLSDEFGNYSFDDVQAGETYVFSVSHKRYTFNQSTQVHSITEETNQVNFVGLPIKLRKRF